MLVSQAECRARCDAEGYVPFGVRVTIKKISAAAAGPPREAPALLGLAQGQATPVGSTETPATLATHALLYVLPSQPQTGS